MMIYKTFILPRQLMQIKSIASNKPTVNSYYFCQSKKNSYDKFHRLFSSIVRLVVISIAMYLIFKFSIILFAIAVLAILLATLSKNYRNIIFAVFIKLIYPSNKTSIAQISNTINNQIYIKPKKFIGTILQHITFSIDILLIILFFIASIVLFSLLFVKILVIILVSEIVFILMRLIAFRIIQWYYGINSANNSTHSLKP